MVHTMAYYATAVLPLVTQSGHSNPEISDAYVLAGGRTSRALVHAERAIQTL